MANTLALIQIDDSESLRHGGRCSYRRFAVYINDVAVEHYADDSPSTNYSSGDYLDRYIEDRIAILEKALGTKCLRGELKGRFISRCPRY